MNTKRTYTMTSRAESVAATRQRIMDALYELACVRTFPEISLEDIARGADVSVQTILRQFGSRAELIDAQIEYGIAQTRKQREAPAGDVVAAMDVLVTAYEETGNVSMLMLAQETTDPQVGRLTELGRQMHVDWVASVFAPFEPDAETMHLLIVATDVYTWKLLRKDRRLSRRATQEHMTRLVWAVLDGNHA